jgi:hypothetical protein
VTSFTVIGLPFTVVNTSSISMVVSLNGLTDARILSIPRISRADILELHRAASSVKLAILIRNQRIGQ